MDRAMEIALFRYKIVCRVLQGGRKTRTQSFKELADEEYDVPGVNEKVKFNWRTFKKWLFLYNRHGFDGLHPSSRADKGKSRKISKTLEEVIVREFKENDLKTVSNFYRHLLKKELITVPMFTETTLRNFLRKRELVFTDDEKKPRKAFEMPHINMLWTADFMHGPYLTVGRKKCKTYLCVIIDDYSRVLVGAAFFFEESSLALQITFRDAVLTYGIPHRLYCDNGKVFVSGYIHMVCARIGTALIHSKPYDSPSRGKIERVIQTVRLMFLPNISLTLDYTLEKLNADLKSWIAGEYNQKVHGSTEEKPIERYLNDIPNVKKREISRNESDAYFYHTIYRQVRNDCTIHFHNQVFEAPSRYMGKKVEIRFPLDNPADLRLFEDNKQIAKLTLLDKHFNAQNTISYNDKEGGEKDV
jgi:transposase InsO family protein